MDRNERTLFMKALGGSVRDYVHKADSQIRAWVSGELKALSELFEERIKQIPEPRNGKDGRDGIDGKDAQPINRTEFLAYIDATLSDKSKNFLESCRETFKEQIIDRIAALPKPKDGIDGKDGKDAEPVDMGELYTKIHEMIDAHLRGLPVPKDGKDGLAGKDGESIHPDTVRLMILDQVNEAVSKIPTPRDGKDGYPGRDALELDILPSVDFAKSYPRGTFAQHRGGVIRAIRNTEPGKSLEDGWIVLWDGLSNIEVAQADDLRSFTVKCQMASGKVVSRQFSMPVVLDRGVYKAGEEYVCGDSVSQNGSVWICVAERTATSPATRDNPDWRLSTKAGRDLRDAKPTAPFDPVVKLR